jgi:peptidoglycan/LPS O-acetylase OafA/YrhL
MSETLTESFSPTGATGERYHFMDCLRAVMMLLGIVLHTSLSYTVTPLGDVWPFKDPSQSYVFDMSVFVIHIFRMPIFFMVAGFFGRMLHGRIGARAFLRHRAGRILLPLAVAWPLLYVPTTAGFIWAMKRAEPERLAATLDFYRSGAFLEGLNFIHLWFLYYLMLFYVLAVACVWLVRRFAPAGARRRVEETFRRTAQRWWAPLAFAPLTMLTLLPMESGGLDTPTTLWPQPSILLAYGLFFGFGWLLYRQADLLPFFRRYAWRRVLIGLALTPVNLLLLIRYAERLPEYDRTSHLLGLLAGSVIVWLMLFGITGLFVRYLNAPSRRWRYIADSSYWLYLLHLPLMIWLPLLLEGVALPAVVKALLVMTAAVSALLLSYHFCVRYTFIGRVLNGTRVRERPAESPGEVLETAPATRT